MASNQLKRVIASLALGGATIALGGVAVQTVAAQQAPPVLPVAAQAAAPGAPAQNGREQFLAAVASKLNVTPDQLKQAMEQARQELGLRQGPGGPGGPGRGPGRGGPGMGFDVAAQAIGITPDQLRQELPGKSLADVAKAHNIDPAVVANALKTEATTHIDQAVSAGRLSADQAAQLKQGLDARINQQLTRQVPADAGQRGDRGQAPSGAPFQRGPHREPAEGFSRGGPRG